MARFVLKKKECFEFALESNPDKVYTLPAIGSLGFDEGKALATIAEEKDMATQGNVIKNFILKYNPELEAENLGDMEYWEIYNAYGLDQGKANMGESQASQS